MSCFTRDLTSEMTFKNQLLGNMMCTIDSDRWQFGHFQGETDIAGVSFGLAPLQRVLKNHVYTLDGETLVVPGDGTPKDLVIIKSLITTIKPDPFHPKTVAKLFEFKMRDSESLNDPMLAVIPINDFPKPDFFHYFGHWA